MLCLGRSGEDREPLAGDLQQSKFEDAAGVGSALPPRVTLWAASMHGALQVLATEAN